MSGGCLAGVFGARRSPCLPGGGSAEARGRGRGRAGKSGQEAGGGSGGRGGAAPGEAAPRSAAAAMAPEPARRGGALSEALKLAVCSTSIALCLGRWGDLSDAAFRTLAVALLVLPVWGLFRGARTAGTTLQKTVEATAIAVSGHDDSSVDALVAHFARLSAQDPAAPRLDRATCRRFLVGRKGDARAALALLERYAAWRAEARPAEITEADVPREVASRKAYAQGVDRQGRGLAWVFVKRHDKHRRDLEEVRKFIIYNMERTVALSEAQGVEQICIVFDLSGFGLKSMDYELVKELLYILSMFYPERLGKVLLVNGPALFNLFWKVVKPWIDPRTLEKIDFVRPKDLLACIDPSMFPEEVADGLV